MEGKVAFNSMGDWAAGEFVKANKKEKEDFGWVSHPGTDGSFIIVADGFTLAKGAPHKEAAIAWLKSIGSKEAQEAFNPLKGSIPARTDVDKSKFDGYHQWSMNSLCQIGAERDTLSSPQSRFLVLHRFEQLLLAYYPVRHRRPSPSETHSHSSYEADVVKSLMCFF